MHGPHGELSPFILLIVSLYFFYIFKTDYVEKKIGFISGIIFLDNHSML